MIQSPTIRPGQKISATHAKAPFGRGPCREAYGGRSSMVEHSVVVRVVVGSSPIDHPSEAQRNAG